MPKPHTQINRNRMKTFFSCQCEFDRFLCVILVSQRVDFTPHLSELFYSPNILLCLPLLCTFNIHKYIFVCHTLSQYSVRHAVQYSRIFDVLHESIANIRTLMRIFGITQEKSNTLFSPSKFTVSDTITVHPVLLVYVNE